MRNRLALCCYAFFAFCFSAPASAEDSSNADAFSRTVIADIDLTQPFGTKSSWRFVATQEPDEHYAPDEDYPGSIHFCFVRNGKPDCSELAGEFNMLHHAEVVDVAGKVLLLVSAGSFNGGPASGNPTTMLWAYRAKTDAFERIFSHYSSRNTNEETRLVTDGSLAGYIVLATRPTRAPYHYGIEVYRLSKSGHYVQTLKFTAKTRWADGNPLAVIDSEMPAILTRLHLWKPGDPLPAPLRMPQDCNGVELREDTEWCAGAAASEP